MIRKLNQLQNRRSINQSQNQLTNRTTGRTTLPHHASVKTVSAVPIGVTTLKDSRAPHTDAVLAVIGAIEGVKNLHTVTIETITRQ